MSIAQRVKSLFNRQRVSLGLAGMLSFGGMAAMPAVVAADSAPQEFQLNPQGKPNVAYKILYRDGASAAVAKYYNTTTEKLIAYVYEYVNGSERRRLYDFPADGILGDSEKPDFDIDYVTIISFDRNNPDYGKELLVPRRKSVIYTQETQTYINNAVPHITE